MSDTETLLNPLCEFIFGRAQAGEEEQELEVYSKQMLEFPSGEPLPRCWLDAKYRWQLDRMDRCI